MNPNEYFLGHVPYKDHKNCFVPNCKNNSVKDAHKTFFAVPRSAKQEWCNAVGVGCPKRLIFICEDHLNLEEDVDNYHYWRIMNGKPKLKNRVPVSLIHRPSNLDITQPSTSLQSSVTVDRGTNYEPTSGCNKAVQVKAKTADRATYCSLHIHKKTEKENVDLFDVESIEAIPSTQGSTTSADFSEVTSEIYEEKKLNGKSFMLRLIEKKPHIYIGVPENYYWLIMFFESQLKVKSLDTIITLYKIKNNIPFYQIADMFQVSLSTIWRIFFKTLCILSQFFQQFIFSPQIQDIKRHLPSSFTTSKEYSNVFCIIDCFEIELEKPSNPIQQSLTWSQYKNANTLKYLIATTPDGFINFVSIGFGGRISDAKIVEKSGFLEVLPENCTLLADRGFKHIETLLSRKHIALLRPPSVSKGTKMTKQEAIKSKAVASLRIHVERVIRRVRLFKLLKPHSVVNNKFIQHMDEAVIVACGLINLQSSIIKNE